MHLTLRHEDGSTEQVSAPWVIGADGAHSAVRKMVGTKLAGSFVGERFLLGDVDAEHSLDLDSMHTFFAPDGPVVVLPMAGRPDALPRRGARRARHPDEHATRPRTSCRRSSTGGSAASGWCARTG